MIFDLVEFLAKFDKTWGQRSTFEQEHSQADGWNGQLQKLSGDAFWRKDDIRRLRVEIAVRAIASELTIIIMKKVDKNRIYRQIEDGQNGWYK